MNPKHASSAGTTQEDSSQGNVLPDPVADTMPGDTTSAPPMASGIEFQPGTVIKHYELIRKLGAGGMGAVFLARDVRLGRLVAIKLLLEHAGPAVERFLAEARITAQCRHDNIVVIYDVDTINGRPYMALEYVDGRTLRDAMAGKMIDDGLRPDEEQRAGYADLRAVQPREAHEAALELFDVGGRLGDG